MTARGSSLQRNPGPVDLMLVLGALVFAIVVSQCKPGATEAWLGLPSSMRSSHDPHAVLKRRWEDESAKSGFRPWVAALKWGLCEMLVATPILVLVTPGVALATYRNRLMFRRRNNRGVGVLTTAIAGGMVVVYLANDYVLRRLSPHFHSYGNNQFSRVWREVADHVSLAILALWVVLALGRRWHAEPHWRDRLGRALGAAWIGYWFLDEVLSPLWLVF